MKKLFTLIELMVVVVIILILASLLLPALDRASEQSRTVTCANNLKQLHTAQYSYASDSDQQWCGQRQWLANNGGSWNNDLNSIRDGALFPYMAESMTSYLCPTFEMVCGGSNPTRSYSMNWNFGGGNANGDNGSRKYARITRITSPTDTLLFCDENSWRSPWSSTGINDGSLVIPTVNSPFRDCAGTYHMTSVTALNDGTANAAFVDGHIGKVYAANGRKHFYNENDYPADYMSVSDLPTEGSLP